MTAQVPSRADVQDRLQAVQAEIFGLGVRRLALFGSVRRDTARPDSDVDQLVEFEPAHPRHGLTTDAAMPPIERLTAAGADRDRFFLLTAAAIGATVLAGVWFTYFGPIIAGAREPDALAVHLHGWSLFAWYALLVGQAALVQSRRSCSSRHSTWPRCACVAAPIGTGA